MKIEHSKTRFPIEIKISIQNQNDANRAYDFLACKDAVDFLGLITCINLRTLLIDDCYSELSLNLSKIQGDTD